MHKNISYSYDRYQPIIKCLAIMVRYLIHSTNYLMETAFFEDLLPHKASRLCCKWQQCTPISDIHTHAKLLYIDRAIFCVTMLTQGLVKFIDGFKTHYREEETHHCKLVFP